MSTFQNHSLATHKLMPGALLSMPMFLARKSAVGFRHPGCVPAELCRSQQTPFEDRSLSPLFKQRHHMVLGLVFLAVDIAVAALERCLLLNVLCEADSKYVVQCLS